MDEGSASLDLAGRLIPANAAAEVQLEAGLSPAAAQPRGGRGEEGAAAAAPTAVEVLEALEEGEDEEDELQE